MKLSDKKCSSCLGVVAALSENEVKFLLSQVENWRLSIDKKWLYKEYKFKDFSSALAFVNKVADISEQQNHHPNIEFTWGYCKILIQTHKINNLCEADFILAAKIDQIADFS